MNPLKLLGGAAKILGSVFGVDLSAIEKALEKDDLSPQQRVMLQDHTIRLKELALEEVQTEVNAKLELMKAELEQEDKFVKRARPTGLYVSYLVSLGLAVALIAGADIDPAAVLTILGPVMGFSGWYTYQRSQEKLNDKN